MVDLKELGIDVSFNKDKKFTESYESYKETGNSFDEIELLHYIGELKRTTELFEEEGQKEDKNLNEYYRKRKERYGF